MVGGAGGTVGWAVVIVVVVTGPVDVPLGCAAPAPDPVVVAVAIVIVCPLIELLGVPLAGVLLAVLPAGVPPGLVVAGVVLPEGVGLPVVLPGVVLPPGLPVPVACAALPAVPVFDGASAARPSAAAPEAEYGMAVAPSALPDAAGSIKKTLATGVSDRVWFANRRKSSTKDCKAEQLTVPSVVMRTRVFPAVATEIPLGAIACSDATRVLPSVEACGTWSSTKYPN
jgi:hypothetical protein